LQDFENSLTDNLKDIQDKLENVENKNEIYSGFEKIISMFYEEIGKITDEYNSKLEYIINNQKDINEKVLVLEHSIDEIEKDIYEDNIEEIEIICPYCNNQFFIDIEETVNQEVKCPECNNIIELLFNDEEHTNGCTGNCSHNCNENCHKDNEE